MVEGEECVTKRKLIAFDSEANRSESFLFYAQKNSLEKLGCLGYRVGKHCFPCAFPWGLWVKWRCINLVLVVQLVHKIYTCSLGEDEQDGDCLSKNRTGFRLAWDGSDDGLGASNGRRTLPHRHRVTPGDILVSIYKPPLTAATIIIIDRFKFSQANN